MKRTPLGKSGVLGESDFKDFGGHAIVRKNTAPHPRLSNQAAAGYRLPAEPGVIVIDGGAA